MLGGVQVQAATLLVDTCLFQNNFAVDDQGALTTNSSTTVTNSAFRWNSGSGLGVAMFINPNVSSVNVSGCQFQYNTGISIACGHPVFCLLYGWFEHNKVFTYSVMHKQEPAMYVLPPG